LLFAAFVVWRVVLRLINGAPELPASMTGIERTLAKTGHVALYALLIVIPVLGILLTWFRGDLFAIPAPFQPDRSTAGLIKELHDLGANGILILAGLHAVAALWHHFVRKDDVLIRMLPASSTITR
jgi:cytochrome b561